LVWAGEIALITLPIFRYDVDYSPKADVFVAGCLLAVTVGYLVCRNPSRSPPKTYWNRNREPVIVGALGALGVLGCSLLLLDAAGKGTQFNFSYLLDNLVYIRNEVFTTDSEVFAGPLALIGQFLAPCSLLAILAASHLGNRDPHRWIVRLAALSLVLNIVVSLFVYGGRTQIANCVLLIFVSLYLTGRGLRVSPRSVLVAVGLMAAVWFFSVQWFEAREGGAVDTEFILNDNQRASLNPLIAPAARNNHSVGSALINLSYFSSPLPTLSFYIQREVPGPFFGGYSYPLPWALAGIASNTPYSNWQDIRRDVFLPLDNAGYFSNVWATWLRDLLVDFGYFGAGLFCGLFGAFMAWARNRYEATGALHYHFLEVISCFVLALGAFQNLLWANAIAYAFFAAVGAMIAGRVTLGGASVTPAWGPAR